VLHIHRAERADGLIDALGALLADPLPDPFAQEVVCVPTRGMERWLTQRLSGRLGATAARSDGVCANADFPSPRRLVGGAIAAASGIAPDEDPWLPERAVWPLLDVVDGCLPEPWLHSLSLHLSGAADTPDAARRGRRFAVVRHVAELFDRYALHRPEMVVAWARGEDTDYAGSPLPANAAWQAELWRRLRDRLDLPGPAERLAAACAQLEQDPDIVGLPQRISLFGLTRLPAGNLRVLRALAVRRDVHLFMLHPSPALWNRLAQRPPVLRRREDITATLTVNRLLASWGQDSREMQIVLAAAPVGDSAEHHHAVEHRTDALLARIQTDVRHDRQPPGPPLPGEPDARPTLDRDDRSVQIHSCHGRARQVEVLRDAILHLLEEDPTLEPRDVIVMCPDIETFAPLIHATFGAGEVAAGEEFEPLPDDVRPPDLRVRLADRSIRQTNPVLGVVAELIDLVDKRLTASQVLGLADREPVRRRFRLDDDDLARMQDWVAESGIRWGLDREHRAPFKLDSLPANTWRAGLDRVLVGVTMTEDEQRLFGGVLPLDDVDSGSIVLAGRLAELVDRLQAAIDALAEPKTVDEWASAIASAADDLTATSPRDAWQRAELQRLLDDVVEQSAHANPSISLPELRSLLAERLQGRPTRSNFRTGHLTICTLVPMRSVPHRVVCLLGLDDGVFPRKAPRDGDDLMALDPRIGERDPRAEDRQMLLDALMAATDRLIITYSGNDERTNTPRPAAVPVGELLDVMDATVRTEDDGPARERVIVRHPLQPFDSRNFIRGKLVGDEPWSFDPVTLEGARALALPREGPRPFLEQPLPPLDNAVVEVDDLVRFVQHPVRAFLRRRLRVSTSDFSDEVEDDLSVELDGLEKWGVGQRLLDARLAGIDGRTAALAEIARGTLPPGVLGKPVIDEVFPIVDTIASAAEDLVDAAGPSGSVDVRVALPDGRSLGGTVPGVSGDTLLTVTYSRVAAKHRMASWVRLLALTAANPARDYSAATIGKAGRNNVTIARIRPLGTTAEQRRATALAHLTTLIDLYDRGMREPLPLYCKTSAAYAEAASKGHDPAAAADAEWTSTFDRDKEDRELEHQLVLGGVLTIDDLLAELPRPDEQGEGWDRGDTTRLGRLAHRMWDGLLACEEFG
jgi:exodeoxyribonuclease V gamma subunit